MGHELQLVTHEKIKARRAYLQVPLPAVIVHTFDVGAVGEVQAARAKVAKARVRIAMWRRNIVTSSCRGDCCGG
jgi:hypothetical protein